MPIQFDPIKIFEWMWQMRWWGRLLTIVTIIVTVFVLTTIFLKWNSSWSWVILLTMWVIFLVTYLQSRVNFRNSLDDLIKKGEHIQAVVNGIPNDSLKQYDTNSDETIERLDQKIEDWSTSITNVLKGTRYENQWYSNAGLTKPEDESKVQGYNWYLVVWRNFMALRLKFLDDVRRSS